MLQQVIGFFTSAFYFRGLSPLLILVAIVMGLVLGAVWLVLYRPALIKKPWMWIVAVVSAFLTWTAIAFIQVPLQIWTGQALLHFWSQEALARWLFLAGVPQILLSGLVQEGAKLVPVFLYLRSNNFSFTPASGLITGAVSGAGFGVFEAIWIFNSIFASGWTWSNVEAGGFMALLGFVERFFAIGLHIGATAVAGYGLAKRLGWQFYLLASLLHGATNYAVILLNKGLLSAVQTEIYVAIMALAVIALALWLRWRKPPLEGG